MEHTLENNSLQENRKKLIQELSLLRIETATREIDALREQLQTLLKKEEGGQETASVEIKPSRINREPTAEEKVANLKTKFTRVYGEPSVEELRYLIDRKEKRLIQLHKHLETKADDYGTDAEIRMMIGYLGGTLSTIGTKTDVHGNAVKQHATYEATRKPDINIGEAQGVDIALHGDEYADSAQMFEQSLSDQQQAQPKKAENQLETLRKNGVFDARTNAVAESIQTLENELQDLEKELQTYNEQQEGTKVKRFSGIRTLFTGGRTAQPGTTREGIEKRIEACRQKILLKKDQLNELHDAGFIELLPDMGEAEITFKLQDLQDREDFAYAHEEAQARIAQEQEDKREEEKSALFSILTQHLDEIAAQKNVNEQERVRLQEDFADSFIKRHPILEDKDYDSDVQLDTVAVPVTIFQEGTGKSFKESDTIVRLKKSQTYLEKVLAERREKALQAERSPKPSIINPNERLFTQAQEVQSKLTQFVGRFAANDSKMIDPEVTSLILIDKDITFIKGQLEDASQRLDVLAQKNKDLKYNTGATLSKDELENARSKNLKELQVLYDEVNLLTDKLSSTIAQQNRALDAQIAIYSNTTEPVTGGVHNFERDPRKSA